MKTLAPSNKIVTTRDPKGLKFSSIVDAAYNKAELSEEEAQRVNDTPGLSDLIGKFIADIRSPNKYKDEERESWYGYLSGYKPRSLHYQINDLRKLFPGLAAANPILLSQIEAGEVAFPKSSEGWFAIPNWIKNPDIFGSTYGEALQKVFDQLKRTSKVNFYNGWEGKVGPQYLRQSSRTEKFFSELVTAQGNMDILIIPAQFGIRHRGRSIRRVREVFLENEFGLGVFIIGIMLLTHPDRLEHYDDLWIDCAGDEFSPDGNDVWLDAPIFCFSDGWVGFCFSARYVSGARSRCGSASGFVPPQK